ncbi:MAG: AAA family ATPase [Candidatus Competibacter sp.]|nr:AAA family ATPase [Candidatus Competibacter sp.]
MHFPYGIADFEKIRRQGYFYQDRTDRIRALESVGEQLLLLRPRRFGKSLWLSTLENYYAIDRAGQFEALFGDLAIGRAPTERRNRYFVLRWNFSEVAATGTADQIGQALHRHLNACADGFSRRYAAWLPEPIAPIPGDGVATLRHLTAAVAATGHKLYLLIDEYDNFANELMPRGQRAFDEDHYRALIHGEGLLKTVFKAVKSAAEEGGLDRVFITGVSPVVLADLSSGYNVAKDISRWPQCLDLCGFTGDEVRQALDAVADARSLPSATREEALDTIQRFYDGYRFDEAQPAPVYNPTLVLYFLDHLYQNGRFPENLLDANLAMDRNRIEYVASLPHGDSVIAAALDAAAPLTVPQLADRFGVRDMLEAAKDQAFMASLLYYLGALTQAGRNAFGELQLVIPNLVIRKLYVEQIRDALLGAYDAQQTRRQAAQHFYRTGDLEPLAQFVETRYFPVFDNRDLRWSNELVVKTAFLVTLFADAFYIMDSEAAVGRGYADLSMILRPDRRQYQLLDHVLEFKTLAAKDLGLNAGQLAAAARETLAAHPRVRDTLAEAGAQLARYRAALDAKYGARLKLRTHAVVCIDLARLVWE